MIEKCEMKEAIARAFVTTYGRDMSKLYERGFDRLDKSVDLSASGNRLLPDEAACAAYLERARWGDGFVCPHCATPGEPYRYATRPGVLCCRKCRRETRLTAGTIMERTHTPLSVWFWAAYLVASQTPGMSAVQFQRQTVEEDFSYSYDEMFGEVMAQAREYALTPKSSLAVSRRAVSRESRS